MLYGGCNRFHENAQRLSRIFRDQRLTPLQQAVYWTEYVNRDKGAPHLRSAVLNLVWYQYFLLDVFDLLVLAIVSILLILLLVCRFNLKKIILWEVTCRKPKLTKKEQNYMKIICLIIHGGSSKILYPNKQFNPLCCLS